MDSYIIRIYRQEKEELRRVIGTAERVGGEGKKAFKSMDELWQILNEPLPRLASAGSQTIRKKSRNG